MDSTTKNHLERLRGQTTNRFTLDQVPSWISKHTKIQGRPYSFADHEFQEKILSDTSQEMVVRKCSQVGLTEASIRLAVAVCAIQPYYTVIYTLPTATFAANVMTTRVDPVITSSEYLSDLIDKATDNAAVKQLGDSFLYMKGSASGNAPISIPADHLIHDELDFCDLGIIEQYQSRLTHSPYKRRSKFSTPTQPKFGIDAEFQESRRHFSFVKCNHCNHFFVPDYYKDVHVPGYTGNLEEVNKRTLPTIRWQEAKVICPDCGKAPSLQIEHRHWVCENPDENYVAAGYQVSPFDAPNIITPSYLIEASTKYARRSQFMNYNLGLPMADSESTFLEAELRAAIVDRAELSGVSFVMGIDMGIQCHIVVAAVLPDGRLLLVHCEQVHHTKVVDRRKELARTYWPRMTVVDAYPYTETVYRMQLEDRNLFAAVYVNKKSIETHSVVDREEDKYEAETELRQVNINRNKALDALMDNVRQGNVIKMRDEMDDLWVAQMQDMKRIQKFTAEQELEYVWSKSKEGSDHFHHATLYAATAGKMLGISHHRIFIPTLVSTFKVKKR